MTRKLFSMLLCAFALLLLMGAGLESSTASIATEEESAAATAVWALETGAQQSGMNSDGEETKSVASAAAGTSILELAAEIDNKLLINGTYAPAGLERTELDGTAYVVLSAGAKALDSTATFSWDAGSQTATVTTGKLTLTAKVGELYLVANGRYLYIPQTVRLLDGQVAVPLTVLAKAFDAQVSWEASTGITRVTTGSGALMSGEQYYNQNDLFWLSRLITAESGNQPLEGQMAVGNVVLNRVRSSRFPNTVEGVIAQKNQFTTYNSGRLANRTPNASSVIAAKLVLDGGVVEETEGALYFDSAASSWASRNRTCIAVIGGHKFYA